MDNPHVKVEIKPQLKPRGSVAEEDPKPFHQVHNQLGGLCVYGVYKRLLRALTKENTLVLIAVGLGSKNT